MKKYVKYLFKYLQHLNTSINKYFAKSLELNCA